MQLVDGVQVRTGYVGSRIPAHRDSGALGEHLWNVSMWARLSRDQKDSMPLVWAMCRAHVRLLNDGRIPVAVRAVVGIGFIRVDVGVRYHVALYEELQSIPVRALYHLDAACPVHQTRHSRLARGTAPGMQAPVGMLAAFPAPEVGLVHFDQSLAVLHPASTPREYSAA